MERGLEGTSLYPVILALEDMGSGWVGDSEPEEENGRGGAGGRS